jgi:hypothetical protein
MPLSATGVWRRSSLEGILVQHHPPEQAPTGPIILAGHTEHAASRHQVRQNRRGRGEAVAKRAPHQHARKPGGRPRRKPPQKVSVRVAARPARLNPASQPACSADLRNQPDTREIRCEKHQSLRDAGPCTDAAEDRLAAQADTGQPDSRQPHRTLCLGDAVQQPSLDRAVQVGIYPRIDDFDHHRPIVLFHGCDEACGVEVAGLHAHSRHHDEQNVSIGSRQPRGFVGFRAVRHWQIREFAPMT